MLYNIYGDSMEKHYIDLSDIKDDDTDKTASFVDLMSRAEKLERKKRKQQEELEKEKKKEENISVLMNDNDSSFLSKREQKKLDKKIEKEEKKNIQQQLINDKNNINFKKELNKDSNKNEQKKENIEKTGILELTRQMKFNMEENIKEEKKKGYNYITDIGVFILIALSYFIYSLIFTDYLKNELFLLIDAGIILFMFLLFGITLLTTKRNNKFLAILNFLILLGFIAFNILNVLEIIK